MDSATKAFVCSELSFICYRAIMQPAMLHSRVHYIYVRTRRCHGITIRALTCAACTGLPSRGA
jgi:hypothetical protein